MRTRLPTVLVLVLAGLAMPGCDFFQELESLPEAGEDGEAEAETAAGAEDDTGETGEPCTVFDDRCSDQDTLHSCNLGSGAIDVYHCAALCGTQLLNFTCTPTPDFRHACWCVSPGVHKLDTCSELEQCIGNCGNEPDSPCTHACFERTDGQTIRLLGALVSCADRACDELCQTSPGECGACLVAAQAGLWGDCVIPRQVCDADKGDEPSWP